MDFITNGWENVAELDETGMAVNCYGYDVFGSIISFHESIENRYTYNGEAYGRTTGRYRLGRGFIIQGYVALHRRINAGEMG